MKAIKQLEQFENFCQVISNLNFKICSLKWFFILSLVDVGHSSCYLSGVVTIWKKEHKNTNIIKSYRNKLQVNLYVQSIDSDTVNGIAINYYVMLHPQIA